MTYVLSDLHGHYDKYRAMLAKIQFKPADTLYILGDVIDRGPDGVKILLDMMDRTNVIPILGNHEFTAAVCLPWLMQEVTDQSLDNLTKEKIAALSEWIANGGGPTLRALKLLSETARRDILEYLREMELYAEVGAGERSFVLVHAGLGRFSPDRPLDDYELSDFIFGRPNIERTYFKDKFLVFGHTPTRVLGASSDTALFQGTQIAVDCGCGFGGKLGCLCLETLREFYV